MDYRPPGRFIDLPDPKYRTHYAYHLAFKINLKKRPIDDDVNVEKLAEMTGSYSGADISAICKEAADIPLGEALRGAEPRKIKMDDFIKVLEQRKPSITSWYSEAKREIKKSGEEEVFRELFH
ncbi:ATP-binding protein [Methanococcoides vulcani]|uniref:hypothetical protein n=1 Tax=Methanococcoides vulcani TaxID=1353158 RepID=UPI003183BB96